MELGRDLEKHPTPQTPPQDKPQHKPHQVERDELRVDELEPRVNPRPIGTFF